MTTDRLELKNLHKRFPGVYAVKGVSFKVAPGEVHALVGENGAGKSTLMKMIIGEYLPDQGDIFHNGTPCKIRCIADAQEIGIAMIHQELAPLPNMTITQNIFLGQELMKNGFVDDRAMNAAAKEILAEYKMDYEPTTYVEKLSVAQIQMLEIIKAVRKNADIIIMDEPTSSLSEEEANKLFTIIKDMTARSVSIIYISHRLEEILKLADKITVLRDGEYIETVDAALVTKNRLIELMVGRSLDQVYPKEEVPIRDTVLKVENLCSAGVFKNISFEVHKGEILGISGLMGAGRSEIMRAIFGMDPCDSGTIRIHGEQVILKSPADAINKKIAMVSEDRKEYGLILCRSIRENISLPNLKKCFKGLFISTRKELLEAQTYESSLGIKCSNLNATVETLSGGNQQKVVLAKWLQSEPEILILDEPTRGIDVGAKFEIYKIMVELAKQGMAIIMVSSELPEIMGMSDRILVISNGQITGEYSRNEIQAGNVTQEELLSNAFKM